MRCDICGIDYPSEYFLKSESICSECYEGKIKEKNKQQNTKQEKITEHFKVNDNHQERENILCPSCMTENITPIDFCKNCGCPIGQFTNIDPLKRIWSQGWVLRRVTSGPISRFTLLGMWLLFGTGLMSCVVFFYPDSTIGIEWIILIASLVVYAVILYRVTANYYRYRKNKT